MGAMTHLSATLSQLIMFPEPYKGNILRGFLSFVQEGDTPSHNQVRYTSQIIYDCEGEPE